MCWLTAVVHPDSAQTQLWHTKSLRLVGVTCNGPTIRAAEPPWRESRSSHRIPPKLRRHSLTYTEHSPSWTGLRLSRDPPKTVRRPEGLENLQHLPTDFGSDALIGVYVAGASRTLFIYNELAGVEGLEPPTLGLEIRCSIHLSYTPASSQT